MSYVPYTCTIKSLRARTDPDRFQALQKKHKLPHFKDGFDLYLNGQSLQVTSCEYVRYSMPQLRQELEALCRHCDPGLRLVMQFHTPYGIQTRFWSSSPGRRLIELNERWILPWGMERDEPRAAHDAVPKHPVETQSIDWNELNDCRHQLVRTIWEDDDSDLWSLVKALEDLLAEANARGYADIDV